jgi:formate dehydrogenase major subunit
MIPMEREAIQVKITIDGKETLVSAGLTILEAARQQGISIPTLCHHPALSERGGCRMCVVEVDGAPRLAASCVTPVRDGMNVVTDSARIIETRRTILEFLFAERNHYCMFCPRSGDCELQDLAYTLHMDHLTVPSSFDAFPVDATSDYIGLDHNRCILCGRCVRACEELSGCRVLNFHNRGPATLIGFDLNETREHSTCTSCGACLQVCPTGALYHRHRTHYAVKGHSRNWRTIRTVCPLCGLLCPTVSTVRDNDLIKIEGIVPAGEGRPDRGILCHLGRFEVLKPSGHRLLHPMARRTDGSWTETSWERALDLTIEGLNRVRDAHGGHAVMGLVSGLSSNEELVCFRDLMESAWQAGAIATVESSGFQNIYGLGPDNGQPFVEASWKKIAEADFILTVGAVSHDRQPAVGNLIRRCLIEHHLRSAVIGPEDFLYPHGTHYLPVKNKDALSLVRLISKEAVKGMKKPAASAGPGKAVRPVERVAATDIVKRLHLDGTAQIVLHEIIRDFVGSINPLILVGENLAAQADKTSLAALVNLARSKGHVHDRRLRLIVLKPCGNSMGAFRLLNRSDRKHQARAGIKGSLIMLEQDPFQDAVDLKIPEDLGFLAVISPCWPDGLDDYAHVLIPKSSWMETDGTWSGLDGCETVFRRKMLNAPAGIKAAWQTLAGLAVRANANLDYTTWEALRRQTEREMQKEAIGEET